MPDPLLPVYVLFPASHVLLQRGTVSERSHLVWRTYYQGILEGHCIVLEVGLEAMLAPNDNLSLCGLASAWTLLPAGPWAGSPQAHRPAA